MKTLNIEVVVILNVVISLLFIILYDCFKKIGKVYLQIFKMKISIIGQNNGWNDSSKVIDENTKYIELDFIFQIYNHKNQYHSIYNIDILQKKKSKYILLDNHYLNLAETMKSISGTKTYEKLKYINLLPYEVKEFHVKIKLEKDEFLNYKKEPIYISYKEKRKTKRIKLNKYLDKKKK